ncbi:PREDICTED: nicastrin [Vollenhovia emeryi]|uniref:nicastrin n=1 Tax=Vollenhovia emeryi TaxID=411798 RepID=UPI0005F48A00|nr:PREDICTED: nicastrin [Vollenhovia emeryi]XP_011877503.1 PREDICTED: nicastrin [Vollenhovia emeryi]XP_011877504.1 PREDICTED: nicastrin [Vollenhovia emeryi]
MAVEMWKLVLAVVIINSATSERIKDMIYMPLEGVAGCFRRHNGTHQFGCSSSRSGSVGVVHLVEVGDDIAWIERNATAGPYTVVLPFAMFSRTTLVRLRNTNNINGVLLTKNISHERPLEYSPEDSCPNRYSGYKGCNETSPWNPLGSALLMEDWPFPMFYTENQTILEAIKTCFWAHNAHDLETQYQRSLCAIEMKSFMYAAVNSESCIKRTDFMMNFNPTQFCDPLGDRNVHWPLAPLDENNNNTVIMVTARLDASSLFDGMSPGAGNAVTGLVTLLATAYYLNLLNATVDKTNVVFSLLNGEAFDYIGSSRMVYDLKQDNFNALGGTNLKFDDIQSVIEFGQLGKGELFLHSNGESDVIHRLKRALNATVLDGSVPPTSVQSFLEAKPDLTTVVISNHGGQFKNRYYNSILDDAESLGFDKNDTSTLASDLAKIALQVANELYRAVTGEAPQPADLPISLEKLTAEMLYCYMESAKCTLFRAASAPNAKLIDQVLPLYVGVHRALNIATTLTGQLLAYLTGERLHDMNETTCHENRLAWMGGQNFSGLCINSTVNYSTAVSPAFIIEGYDMKSGVYSTWTESIWQTLSVRMFLKPAAATERFSMILGSLVAGFSFVLVWLINSRADVLFNSRRTVDC